MSDVDLPSNHGHRERGLPSPCPSCLSPRTASAVGCLAMTLIYAAWTVILYQAWGTAAQVRSSSASAAFDEVALSLRFTVCTSLFCATMTLLCLGAFGVSFFPQRDAARWLSRAIWVGWLCTWGFGVFGLTAFISSDNFVTSFCSAASCSISRQDLRSGTTCFVFLTLVLICYLGVVLTAYVHTLHPHIFLSPDSDSEDEYSDPDEAFQHKLEAHLVSYYIANHALHRESGAFNRGLRGGSRRRTPYSEDQEDHDLDRAGSLTSSAKALSRTVASSSDSGGSSSTYRQKPRAGDDSAGYRRGHPEEETSSDSLWGSTSSESENAAPASSMPRPYDAPRDRSRAAQSRRASE
ncbi:hypothetical protein JCM3774_004082 [Rhodotorula dairenensis]